LKTLHFQLTLLNESGEASVCVWGVPQQSLVKHRIHDNTTCLQETLLRLLKAPKNIEVAKHF